MAVKIPNSTAGWIGLALGYKAIADELLFRLSATELPVDLKELQSAIERNVKSTPMEGLSYEADHEATKTSLETVVDYFNSIEIR